MNELGILSLQVTIKKSICRVRKRYSIYVFGVVLFPAYDLSGFKRMLLYCFATKNENMTSFTLIICIIYYLSVNLINPYPALCLKRVNLRGRREPVKGRGSY